MYGAACALYLLRDYDQARVSFRFIFHVLVLQGFWSNLGTKISHDVSQFFALGQRAVQLLNSTSLVSRHRSRKKKKT